jgi:hypothetical protein
MLSVVAPEVVQLNVLMPPSGMLVGLAVKELIEGRVGCVTVTVRVAVAVPEVFVAVSVYVVVAVGLRTTIPLEEVDANVPGVMAIPVAPVEAQLTVVVEPLMMDVGLAENELMVGAATCLSVGSFAVQPAIPIKAASSPSARKELRDLICRFLPDCIALREWGKYMRRLSIDDPTELSLARCSAFDCALVQSAGGTAACTGRSRSRTLMGSCALSIHNA